MVGICFVLFRATIFMRKGQTVEICFVLLIDVFELYDHVIAFVNYLAILALYASFKVGRCS